MSFFRARGLSTRLSVFRGFYPEIHKKRQSFHGHEEEMGIFLKKLRGGEYDLIIDFHGIIKSALFSKFVKGKRTIGFGKTVAKEKSHFFYGERVENENKRLQGRRNMLIPRHLGTGNAIPESKAGGPA